MNRLFDRHVERRASAPTWRQRRAHIGLALANRSGPMKYMLIMTTPRDGYTQFMKWPKKLLEANAAFMQAFTKRLKEAGELVAAEGLGSPDQAKLVRAGQDGEPITDGVFPE